MSDGIKFTIDLDGKNAGAVDAAKKLHDVEHAADAAGRKLREAGERGHFGSLTRDIFTAEVAIEGLEKGAEFAKEGFELLYDAIKDTIRTAAEGQRTHAVFENLLGENAEETLEYLKEWSELTEFSQKETRNFGAELLRVGYSGDRFEQAMAAIGDSAAQSTDRIGGAQDALNSLVRMQRTGRVDARTLGGLKLDARDVTKDIAKALGMTPKAVKKGLNEGIIPAAAAFESILKGIEKKTKKPLGEATAAMRGQLSTSLAKLSDLPEEIMKGVEGSQGLKDLQVGIEGMLKVFDPKSETGKAMIDGLSSLIGEVGRAFKEIDWKQVGVGVRELTDDLKTLLGPMEKIARFVFRIGSALHEFGTRIGDQMGDRDLAWQREQMRTIKNRHLTGEVQTAEEKYEAQPAVEKAKKDEAYRQYEIAQMQKGGMLPLPEAQPLASMPALAAMPPLPSSAAGGTSSSKVVTNTIGAPQTTINVYGASGKDARDTGEAVEHAVGKANEEFISHLERTSAMSGLGN